MPFTAGHQSLCSLVPACSLPISLAHTGALTVDDQERWIREIPLYVMFYEGIM